MTLRFVPWCRFALALLVAVPSVARADDPINHPQGNPGELPVGEDGQPLNFDFETGTLKDWTATGAAWDQQPFKGEIAGNKDRPFQEGKKSLHTGEWWLGGYERFRDAPTGTLTSVPFKVTHAWCSFLLGGGAHAETRVELVREEGDQVFFRISGVDREEMRPVAVNLQGYNGQKIYIRIIDEHTGGWGHVNFDDFRFHRRRPRFQQEVLEPRSLVVVGEVYPHAGLTAEEAARAMQVPPGFSVQVGAAEPDVQQPIAMAIDDRGRVWIAEAFSYPQREEPGKGKDRILIFEDTDLNGTLDKRTVFCEGLNLVSGLEVGFGGVWVGAAPYLLFIPDRNGNDIPDGMEFIGQAGSDQAVADQISRALMLNQQVQARELEVRLDEGSCRISGDVDDEQMVARISAIVRSIPEVKELDLQLTVKGARLEQVPEPLWQFPADVPPGAAVLLDGWHYEDTHETLNAFIWGPDGWLYGCHGVFTHSVVGKPGTPDEERVPLNAGIWRYHPVRHEFEVFAHGTSNPWGVDFDDFGQCFCTACVIPHLFHIIPGARYERQAGPHFNEFTYDDIKTIARHRHYVGNQWNDNDRKRSDDLGGGHAHAGAMFYLGGAWPDEYRNQLFMNNIHGNRVNVDRVWHEGSGYVGDRAPDFLLTGDKWSQTLYHTYGPDGQVWVIDWYDANQCHRPEEGDHDRTNGRIYRVAYNDAKPVQVDLQKATDVELARMMGNANDWYVRHARRVLQERAAAGQLAEEAVDELRSQLFPEANSSAPLLAESQSPQVDARRLRALWALHVINDHWLHDEVTIDRLLTDASPWLRSWTVQLLADGIASGGSSDGLLQKLTEMAQSDPSPTVRLALASLAGRMPVEDRWEIVASLASHAEDAADHNLPLMYWYAMEPLGAADPQRALALALSAGAHLPLLRDFMVRRIGSGDPKESLKLLVEGLQQAQDDATRLTFLNGIDAAVRTQSEPAAPEGWDAAYADVLAKTASDEVRLTARGLAAVLGNERAFSELSGNILEERSAALQRRAVEFLVQTRNPDVPQFLGEILKFNPSLHQVILRGLSQFDDPSIPADILNAYDKFGAEARRDALNTLASRPAFARTLLDAVRDNRIARDQLTADLVRQLRNLNDPELSKLIEQVWGVVRDTPEDRARMISQLKALMESPRHPPVDRELGRAIFAKTCQQCHTLFGTGAKIGPDITGANRSDPSYLLSNIVDPSAVMAKEYRPSVLALEDGRIVTGIVKEETAAALTVQTATELQTIPASDIADRRDSDKSMMPDDQLKVFSEHQIRSLLAYVSGAGQTPLLATQDNVSSFFNGESLTGWVGNSDLWSVESGEIIGKTEGLDHNEFLVSQLALEDFRFKCEVKLLGNQGNSGIQLRSQPLSDGEVRGYQADVGVGWWGKIYEERGRGLLVDNDAEKHVRPGEWNTYEIVAVGSRVRTWINGQSCVDLDDPAGARRGVIALQLHSGGATEVRFRNFALELIYPNPLNNGGGYYPSSTGGKAEGEITWKKMPLDNKFRGEGVAVADFNNDGIMDVASGSLWFEQGRTIEQRARRTASGGTETYTAMNSTWIAHSVLDPPEEYNIDGYSKSFMNWPEDLNGDGRLDLIVVDFPGEPTWWFENPGSFSRDPQGSASPQPWKRHQIMPVTNNESPQYLDVDADGRREIIAGFEDSLLGLASPKTHSEAPWSLMPISLPGSPGTDRFSHGLGTGDLNGDGRQDVLITNGWWEQPEDPTEAPWRFHEAPFGAPCSQMYVFDYDGDGDADVLSGSAHDFGIWWYEQRLAATREGSASNADATTEPTWVTHEIDTSYSETHAVVLADINGDGLPDFVTGKRWWSHNGHGPGADGAAVLNWYELQREDGEPVWIRHEIDADSGVGTQFTVADVNGDGLLDVVTSNKKGTYVFEQVRQ
jgi:putative membrane-bound dehydrogenase-like protein